MTIGRTGLSRSPFSSTARDARFTRDREDGGGGGTDDEIDVEDDTDDEDEDEDGDEDEPKPAVKPDGKPFTQADLDALNLALRNARRDARQAKKSGNGKDGGKDSKPDPALIEEATTAAIGPWKQATVRREARGALKDAGLIGEPKALLRLIDMDEVDVEVDDDGEVTIDGLTEQITDLRRQYPSLFRKKRGSGAIDAADRTGGDGKKRSASEIQAMALRGQL